jgi:hypothetical protein
MGLGPLKKVGLSAARQAARKYWDMVRQVDPDRKPIDPLEQRRMLRATAPAQAAKGKATFRNYAQECIAAKHLGWTDPKHLKQWDSTLV